MRKPSKVTKEMIVQFDSDGDDSDVQEDSEPVARQGFNLPAHQTKHLDQLDYHFHALGTTFLLTQKDTSGSTGSSLWLSSQVLSSYLISLYHKSNSSKRNKAIELGSGTGLLSLLLANLGWEVMATDIPPVLDLVLRPNVDKAHYILAGTGKVEVCELDWCAHPSSWAQGDFDLILTADTIYEPRLIRPLFSCFAHYRAKTSKPRILLALERRDSSTADQALQIARDEFGLDLQRIPQRRVRKVFDTLGDGKVWKPSDWEGVEIWIL